MCIGAYVPKVAEYDLEPEWPALSMNEILRIAFQDTFITTPDHPVLQQLSGKAQ